MDYFIYNDAIKGVGNYPQLKISPGGGPTDIYNIDYWQKYDKPFNLPVFERYNKRVKLTDFMSCVPLMTGQTLVLSEKGCNVLSKYFPKETLISPITIKVDSEEHQYYYAYLNEINNEYIDFERSLFFREEKGFSYPKPAFGSLFKFENKEKYENAYTSPGSHLISYHSLLLNEKSIEKEIFRIKGACQYLMFSENVVNALEKNKLTGYRLLPLSSLHLNRKYIAGHYLFDL
jgi:hypothetical protein